MSPTVVHVAPHPDDEALGCPGALLHLFDRGWEVVSVLASLGFPHQWERRRAEFEEASRRAELRAGRFSILLLPSRSKTTWRGPPSGWPRSSPASCRRYGASVVVSPSPHDVHHGHEAVARGVQRAMDRCRTTVRWWMWGIWGDLPAPNVFFPFGEAGTRAGCCTFSRPTKASSNATTTGGCSPVGPVPMPCWAPSGSSGSALVPPARCPTPRC